jgi:hypothetical protein
MFINVWLPQLEDSVTEIPFILIADFIGLDLTLGLGWLVSYSCYLSIDEYGMCSFGYTFKWGLVASSLCGSTSSALLMILLVK